jgi:hypothetical protein
LAFVFVSDTMAAFTVFGGSSFWRQWVGVWVGVLDGASGGANEGVRFTFKAQYPRSVFVLPTKLINHWEKRETCERKLRLEQSAQLKR